MGNKIITITAAFRGIHVSPAKNRVSTKKVLLPDRQTPRKSDPYAHRTTESNSLQGYISPLMDSERGYLELSKIEVPRDVQNSKGS